MAVEGLGSTYGIPEINKEREPVMKKKNDHQKNDKKKKRQEEPGHEQDPAREGRIDIRI